MPWLEVKLAQHDREGLPDVGNRGMFNNRLVRSRRFAATPAASAITPVINPLDA
jgi:hypothetical protein